MFKIEALPAFTDNYIWLLQTTLPGVAWRSIPVTQRPC